MTFGDWLRREIENREMTGTQFAAASGITREHLSRLLNNHSRPTGLTVVRMAKAMGVPREVIDKRLPRTVAA